MAVPTAVGLRVLVAESHRTVAQALTQLVGELGHACVTGTATTPPETFDLAVRLQPDVALVDLELSPDCSLVTAIHRFCPDVRIVVLADRNERASDLVVRAMASGAVGAIYKEATLEELQRAVRISTSKTPVVPEDATGVLLESYIDALTEKRNRDVAMIKALAGAVEIRDSGTGQHLHRVTTLARACLAQIDPDLASNEEIGFGFLLHDVGKIGIPDAILNKPGPLTADEWKVMRRHPQLGLDIVGPVGLSSAATDIILCHHERWDGTGYPHKLVGEEIPLAARVFAVADSYDAMTSDRPYRLAMTPGDARQIIKSQAGRLFDPDMVDALLCVTTGAEAPRPAAVIDLRD
ncbi:MAG TPA: HD domain-containing phosphohydrolase [Actinomycetota bacterium]|nr:HD domain-containing phosphohydrolase [Actinomycetota bacterium]